MKTIIASDGFGKDKTVTKKEFQELWSEQVQQLRNLTWRFGWADRVDAMKAEVQNEAGREFDRIWTDQNSEVL